MTITKNGKRNRQHIGNAELFTTNAPRICVRMEAPTIKEFGWADFPLLQQSLVPDSELPLERNEAMAAESETTATTNVVTATINNNRDVLSSLASSKSSACLSETIRRRRKHTKFGKSHSSSSLSSVSHCHQKKQRRGSKHAHRNDDLDRKPTPRKVAPPTSSDVAPALAAASATLASTSAPSGLASAALASAGVSTSMMSGIPTDEDEH